MFYLFCVHLLICIKHMKLTTTTTTIIFCLLTILKSQAQTLENITNYERKELNMEFKSTDIRLIVNKTNTTNSTLEKVEAATSSSLQTQVGIRKKTAQECADLCDTLGVSCVAFRYHFLPANSTNSSTYNCFPKSSMWSVGVYEYSEISFVYYKSTLRHSSSAHLTTSSPTLLLSLFSFAVPVLLVSFQ